jgi:hypothetical protein
LRDYAFNVQIAVAYGVDEAILVHAMEFWIKKNRANERNFNDGRWWSYNSLAALGELFPFWSKRQLERVIASCREKGILYVGDYNEDRWKRTTWYALDDRIFEIYGDIECISRNGEMHFTESGNADTKSGNAFHETGKCTQIKTPVNNPVKKPVKPPITPQQGEASFDAFWMAYPRKTNKQAARKAWDRLKPGDDLLKTMLAAIERQRRSPQWVKDGGQYIPHPSTWLNGRRWEDDIPVQGVRAISASEREVVPEWT